MYKIFSSILVGLIAPYAANISGPYQRSITPIESAINQIFSLWQAMKKLFEYGQQLHHLFNDFAAPMIMPMIVGVELQKAMREFYASTKVIRPTGLTLPNMREQIKAAISLSRVFNIDIDIMGRTIRDVLM